MTVDTGFEDVIAGEVFAPDPPPQPDIQPPISGPSLITATVTELSPPAPAPLPDQEGLTDDGVQAAKALVHLPILAIPELAKLAREMAMDIKERHVILQDFGLSQVQYDFLAEHNEFFKNALSAASIEWHAPLSTAERIKVEAAAILEDSLPGLGARMQNKAEGLPGVIEAAKLFAKVAGVGEREGSSAGSGERFTINIDLGGDTRIAVTATAAAPSSEDEPLSFQIPENLKAG